MKYVGNFARRRNFTYLCIIFALIDVQVGRMVETLDKTG